MSPDDVQLAPCRGAKQALATHLDKGEPQDVVGHTVKPQRLQMLPVSAVAGDQELGCDEGCQGNCCPPGNHNGKHSCPHSHLQPSRTQSATEKKRLCLLASVDEKPNIIPGCPGRPQSAQGHQPGC